jgi:hypothetical protein
LKQFVAPPVQVPSVAPKADPALQLKLEKLQAEVQRWKKEAEDAKCVRCRRSATELSACFTGTRAQVAAPC